MSSIFPISHSIHSFSPSKLFFFFLFELQGNSLREQTLSTPTKPTIKQRTHLESPKWARMVFRELPPITLLVLDLTILFTALATLSAIMVLLLPVLMVILVLPARDIVVMDQLCTLLDISSKPPISLENPHRIHGNLSIRYISNLFILAKQK